MHKPSHDLTRLLFVAVFAWTAGCSPGPSVLVTVIGLPEGAATLHPSIGVDGLAARSLEPFALSEGGGDTSFSLRLPSGAAGLLTLGLGVLDGSGCLLGTGVSEGEIVEELELRAIMTRLAAPVCTPAPIVLGFTPSSGPTDGNIPVLLHGFGLGPDAVLRFDGTPASQTTFRSSVELSVLLPPRRGFGKVPVQLEQQGGTQVEAGIFRYVSTDLDFQGFMTDLPDFDSTAFALSNLDGNSVPDAVVLSRARKQMRVVLNDRVGPVGKPAAYSVGEEPSAVAIGDLNQDGMADLAVSNMGDAQVSVFLNRGGGSFRDGDIDARTDYPVDGRPSSLALGDVDGDGKLDVVVLCQTGNKVNVLLNQGGTFAARVSYELTQEPLALALADINGDGRPDVLFTGTRGNALTVLKNAGDGRFPQGLGDTYLLGDGVIALAVADLDGDGQPDVVLSNDGKRGVCVLVNRGGKFPDVGRENLVLEKRSVTVATGDVNGDDQPDVVAASAEDQSVTVLLNVAGRFIRYEKEFTAGAGTAPLQVLVQDITSDGRADIAILGPNRFVGLQNLSP